MSDLAEPAAQFGDESTIAHGRLAPYAPNAIARPGEKGQSPQSLNCHCDSVARRATQLLSAALSDAGEALIQCIGLFHDFGKALPEWQATIRGIGTGAGKLRLPPHSVYGARYMKDNNLLLGCMVALAHHSGLVNLCDLKTKLSRGTDGKYLQLSKQIDSAEGMSFLVDRARAQATAIEKDLAERTKIMVFVRCLLSALVDADRLDSEAHEEIQKNPAWARPTFRRWDIEDFITRLERFRARKFSSSSQTLVNDVRAEVLERARDAATQEPGFFDLTVPTGGGKTLTALEFALRHAAAHREHGFRRVIFVIPYLSIIEQNADVYRDALADSGDIVLEHHSSIEIPTAEAERDEPTEEDPRETRRKAASENWDAPIVVTTSVQFLETLLSNRPSRLRKLHNIARSVVVFDEVQTLPRHLLKPTVQALKGLRDVMGCTVVFSTATQPALSATILGDQRLDRVRAIIPPEQRDRFFKDLARTRYDFSRATRRIDWGELVESLKSEKGGALCVVNTRRHARLIAEHIPEALHFSSSMCPWHRRETIDRVRSRLKNGGCVLVSTQAIECGVDVSFPAVFRAIAPLEGIIQAAGRCNREGELGPLGGQVVVFEPPESDGAIAPPDKAYTDGIEAVRTLLSHNAAPDLHKPDLYDAYSRALLSAGKGINPLDEKDILGDATKYMRFREIARDYRLIDEATVPIVTPYRRASGESAHEVIEAIRCRLLAKEGPQHITPGEWAALQRYTVSLFKGEFQRLVDGGWVLEVVLGLWFLKEESYSNRFGVMCPEGLSFQNA